MELVVDIDDSGERAHEAPTELQIPITRARRRGQVLALGRIDCSENSCITEDSSLWVLVGTAGIEWATLSGKTQWGQDIEQLHP